MKSKLAYFGDGIKKACYHAGNREKTKCNRDQYSQRIDEHEVKPQRT
jgi:hypothetical protein